MANTVHRAQRRYRPQLIISILLVFVVFFAPWALLALAPEIAAKFALWYLAANAVWLVPALLWVGPYVRSIEYELGEHELIVRRGIITRSTDMVPYHMITNVALRRGPLARALGLGTLKVHTAGYSQSSASEATLSGVSNYEELREVLTGRVRGAEGAPAVVVAAGTTPEQELLASLLEELRNLRADLKR